MQAGRQAGRQVGRCGVVPSGGIRAARQARQAALPGRGDDGSKHYDDGSSQHWLRHYLPRAYYNIVVPSQPHFIPSTFESRTDDCIIPFSRLHPCSLYSPCLCFVRYIYHTKHSLLTMLRSGVSRSAFRALSSASSTASSRTSFTASQFSSKLCTLSRERPMALAKPLTMALARHQSQGPPYDRVDASAEKKLAEKRLKGSPETVSSTSSTHALFAEVGVEEKQEKDTDMMAGVKSDLVGNSSIRPQVAS